MTTNLTTDTARRLSRDALGAHIYRRPEPGYGLPAACACGWTHSELLDEGTPHDVFLDHLADAIAWTLVPGPLDLDLGVRQ